MHSAYAPPQLNGHMNGQMSGQMNGGQMSGQMSGQMNGHMMNGMPNGMAMGHGSASDLRSDSEQLIPTAIVIKNIPFAIRKEALANIMLDMHLPQPYAFNYHFDSGVFRGLAFANFQNPEDTRAVIDAMNGMDVQGRKLRVEYKKMLPEAERERIERDKRERRGQLEEQHRGPILHQQSSIQSLSSMPSSQLLNSQMNMPSPAPQQQQQHQQQHQQQDPVDLTSMLAVDGVDLNDPDTLHYFMKLLQFKSDDTQEILTFPKTATPDQRRIIHTLAHNLKLHHRSMGDEQHHNRQVSVLKKAPPQQVPIGASYTSEMQKRSLSRATTFNGPMLELPGSPDSATIPNNLRAAKSFADLRYNSPSPSQSSSGFLNPAGNMPIVNPSHYAGYTQQSSSSPIEQMLSSTLGGLTLGSYHSASSDQRPTPGAIGSQRPGPSNSGRNVPPERQPRIPDWESPVGFGGRGRINGHRQRDSGTSSPLPQCFAKADSADSSNDATRPPAAGHLYK